MNLLTPAQTEKELRTAPWLRSIRLDVFTLDEKRTVYNTEMQKEPRNDLSKRSRYYQGLMDSSLLEPGVTNFNLLNNTYIIMITPFDLFGAGKYCYTFHAYCKEDKDLRLQDGATRIFLNTRGTNDEEVSKELRDLLHYIDNTDKNFADQTGSERIRKLHACVSRIKSSEEMGIKYMQTWEEKLIVRQQGREEGRAEGLATGKQLQLIMLVRKKMEKGHVAEQIADALEESAETILTVMECLTMHPDFTDEQIFQELHREATSENQK